MQKENNTSENCQYVGPYRLEKTLGKGQTGNGTKIEDNRIKKLFIFYTVRSSEARRALCYG